MVVSRDALDERERLLATTRALIGRSGLSGLKLENVLTASGLSTRAFYRCFTDKHDLLRAVAVEYAERLTRRSQELLASVDDSLEGIRRWIDMMLDVDGDDEAINVGQALSRHWQEIRIAHPDAIVGAITDLHSVLVEALRELKRRGHPHLRPADDAGAILMLTQIVLEQRLIGRPPMDFDMARQVVWPFVQRSLTLRAMGDDVPSIR